ncbi:small acid-soluble spore protein K [Salipaludibacillus sp. CF4.18]|uniref:small acid-soluble spore protein K n=1 Tax=Salipaludibacillus sp. CF4.18 TaxID=3373081 RepID=UPI003EE4C2BA
MRNNSRQLPSRISLDTERHEADAFVSKRPDGSIKDHPQERMAAAPAKDERNHR